MDARSHTRAGAFLLAAIAGPEAGRLSAQVADSTSRDSAVELAPIDVRSSIVPAAGAGVGSGVPARISIIGRSRIDAWQPRLMADLLGASAGVSLYDDLGTPYKLNLSTRGFSAGPTVGLPPGISVFLDGVRQNEPDASEVNFDLLPMAHVERIELLSGTASLLGPNSLGGAVNLVTRRGRGPLSAELETSGGSFGSWSAAGTVSGSSAGGWDFHAGGGYDTHDGWREATGARRYNLFGSAGRQSAQRGIRLQLLAARSRAETAGSLPESIFHAAPRTNFTAGDFENLNAQQIILSGFTRAGRGLASFTAFGRRSDAERYNVNQAPDDNVRSFTRNYSAGATADWRVTTATGPGV